MKRCQVPGYVIVLIVSFFNESVDFFALDVCTKPIFCSKLLRKAKIAKKNHKKLLQTPKVAQNVAKRNQDRPNSQRLHRGISKRYQIPRLGMQLKLSGTQSLPENRRLQLRNLARLNQQGLSVFQWAMRTIMPILKWDLKSQMNTARSKSRVGLSLIHTPLSARRLSFNDQQCIINFSASDSHFVRVNSHTKPYWSKKQYFVGH